MKIVLWGAKGHALVLHELFLRDGIAVAALFDNDATRTSPIPGVPVYAGEAGFKQWLEAVDPSGFSGLAAIGGARGLDRLAVHELFRKHGVRVASAVHQRAFVASTAILGEGVQVLAGAAVGAQARLGEAVIVNTNASVDHECVLDDGVHVGPGATLCGCIAVGRNAFIGAAATILPGLTVGASSIVGAGAVVTANVPEGAVVAGVPARAVS